MCLALPVRSSLARMTCCRNQCFTSLPPPPPPLGAYQGASLGRGGCSLPRQQGPATERLVFLVSAAVSRLPGVRVCGGVLAGP